MFICLARLSFLLVSYEEEAKHISSCIAAAIGGLPKKHTGVKGMDRLWDFTNDSSRRF